MMGIPFRSIVTAAALVAAVITALGIATYAASSALPNRYVVEIHKFKFVPAVVKAAPGDTIVWINRDIVPHTATATNKATNKKWTSVTLKKGDQWQTVVRSDMPSAYYCRFHPAMKGRIQIVH
jgi:plastocyanin